VPLRRTFRLTAIVPRLHLRYDRTTAEGAHQQRQLETLWRSLESGVEEAASQVEGNQGVEGGLEESDDLWCTYCGWPLDGSVGESEDNYVRVPVPCAHGGFVHARCMLDRAEHLSRGHTDPRPRVACRSAWPGGSRPPHPAELARGLPMNEYGGRWVAVRGALQFAARVQRGNPEPEPASYVTTGAFGTFELMLRAHGGSPTSSFLLCSLFCDALDMPQGAYLDFPRPRGWEAAVGHYRTLFAAYAIQPQDVLLRLPNQRLYIGPHVQEYLVGLDAECEERLARWTLGVQRALETGDALPPFLAAVATTSERTDRAPESDQLQMGPGGQGGDTRSEVERRQNVGNRGASPCTYCGRALEESTGDLAVDSLWASFPCPHGEQVHARCMLDRAECLARGQADPQPCAACRSEWPARNRPLHPAELAEDLPRPRLGGRWSAVAGALQFAELLEEDGPRLEPASYVTTGSHDTWEEMVRTHGGSPTSSFLLCTLFSDALGLPQGAYLDFPRPREWRAAAGHYREVFAAYGIRPQDIVLRLQNRRIYILPHVQEFLAGLDSTWEDRLTRWTLGVRNALEAGEALPPFPTEAGTLGSINVFEPRNALPPSPTAAGATVEGTDPALESSPLTAGVTLSVGEASVSEGDPRVRRQAEPGDAGYVAAENFRTAGDGDTTAPGHLSPLPRQPNATPTTAGATTEGTEPARASNPLAAGVTPPEGEAPSPEGEPGVRGQAEPGHAASVAPGNPHTARDREATAPGRSPPPLTQPSITPATTGATASTPTGAVGGGGSARGRRGRPRGSRRGSRAAISGRGAATSRGRVSRPGSGEPPTAPGEEGGGDGGSELRREGGDGEGGGPAPGSVSQLRAFIADDQSGTTCGGCRATIARRHRVVGLPCGRQHAMHARCVVNAARRGGAQVPLLCGARGCTARHGRREALEAAVQADPGLRVTAAGLGGRPDDREDGRRDGLLYPWDQNTLGIAGPLDDVPLEDLQQRFVTVVKVQSRLATAHAKLITHVLGLLNHALGEHRPHRQSETPTSLLRSIKLCTSSRLYCTRRMAE